MNLNVTMARQRSFEPRDRRFAVRRMASTFFAIVFIFVGVIHAASHFDEISIGSEQQISTSTIDPDSGGKADANGICHCVFCAGFVLPTVSGSPVAEVIESKFEPSLLEFLSPHNPTFPTPPPKRLI